MKKTLFSFLILSTTFTHQSKAVNDLETRDEQNRVVTATFNPAFTEFGYKPYEAGLSQESKWVPTIARSYASVAAEFPTLTPKRAKLWLAPPEGGKMDLSKSLGRIVKFRTPALDGYNYLQFVFGALCKAQKPGEPIIGEHVNTLVDLKRTLPESDTSLDHFLNSVPADSFFYKGKFNKGAGDTGYNTTIGYTFVHGDDILILIARRGNSQYFSNMSDFGRVNTASLANFTFIDRQTTRSNSIILNPLERLGIQFFTWLNQTNQY